MKNIVIIVLSCFLFACGGGSGGSSSNDSVAINSPTTPSTPESTPESPQQFTGTFVDAPVAGLRYATETQSGVTNSQGEFNYLANEKVTFSIGSITFPTIDAASVITPLNLFNTNDINNSLVVNVLRLLQSLDLDGIAGNGIQIPTLVHELTSGITVDVSSDLFEQQIDSLLTLATTLNLTLVSADEAIYHFQQTLEALNGEAMGNCAKTHRNVGWSGNFNTLAHNVSGKATLIDDCTIRISEFYYDGGGPEVYIYPARIIIMAMIVPLL
ncbi:DM13 domain-containing protein [Colwellia maritima]|uniref:DM13 domain-containing protein n=1 Tax=Colwellia maritima TaxID=2912588 RepID=UPI00237B7EAC|nr:DM13 domain-containing protein [Colwellia maritima]